MSADSVSTTPCKEPPISSDINVIFDSDVEFSDFETYLPDRLYLPAVIAHLEGEVPSTCKDNSERYLARAERIQYAVPDDLWQMLRANTSEISSPIEAESDDTFPHYPDNGQDRVFVPKIYTRKPVTVDKHFRYHQRRLLPETKSVVLGIFSQSDDLDEQHGTEPEHKAMLIKLPHIYTHPILKSMVERRNSQGGEFAQLREKSFYEYLTDKDEERRQCILSFLHTECHHETSDSEARQFISSNREVPIPSELLWHHVDGI